MLEQGGEGRTVLVVTHLFDQYDPVIVGRSLFLHIHPGLVFRRPYTAELPRGTSLIDMFYVRYRRYHNADTPLVAAWIKNTFLNYQIDLCAKLITWRSFIRIYARFCWG